MQPASRGSTGATGSHLSLALPPVDGHGLVVPPKDGPRALGTVYLRYLTVTCQRFLALGPQLPAPLQPAHRRAAAAVTRAYAKNPRALLGCFVPSTIGTPLHCVGLREVLPDFAPKIDAAAARITPHVLLELATRKLLDPAGAPTGLAAIDWPAAPILSSLALEITIQPPPAATALRFENGRLTALAGAAPIASISLTPGSISDSETPFTIERAYHRAGRVTRLGLVDHNPIAAFEAHPDKAGNHIDLGDRDGKGLDDWRASLDEAFGLIEAHCPDLFAEMGMMLHEVIPVGYHAERHLSASYREAIGTIYVTLHGNLMTMAEALIHEFQHNKANAACYGADFLVNAFEPRYPSPVRPDPRPLWGILLAVHAFLPVAVLYRRMRAASHPRSQNPDFQRRLAEIDLKNHEGMEMLRAHAEWLPVGKAMFDELDALDRSHMAERATAGLSTKPTEIHLA